ncbi:MAG: hypothetical protein Q9186_000293 [Xanthomendoza sp. 1 TL-2023]
MISQPEHLRHHQSFSDVDNDVEWDKLSGITNAQTVGFNVYQYVSQLPFANTTRHQATELFTSQAEDPPTDGEAMDDDTDLGSLISERASIESTALGQSTSQAEDPSATLNISDSPEDLHWTAFYPPPQTIDPSARNATRNQGDDSLVHPGFINLPEASFHNPYAPRPIYEGYAPDPYHNNTMDLIWYYPSHPPTYLRSPTPENPLDFFAQLAKRPCADLIPENDLSTTPLYPPHHPTNPPRTKLTSLPSLLPHKETSPLVDTPIEPPLIVPASTQFIFAATMRAIEKVNGIATTKRRDRQFGMPPPRKCFGLRLPPSREFVKLNGMQQRRKIQQPRMRLAVKGDGEGQGREVKNLRGDEMG